MLDIINDEERYWGLIPWYSACFASCSKALQKLKKYILYLFLEGGEGRYKEKERNIDVWEKHQLVASYTCPSWGPACNPGMCPDQGSNQWPFTLQGDTQPSYIGQGYSNFLIQLSLSLKCKDFPLKIIL